MRGFERIKVRNRKSKLIDAIYYFILVRRKTIKNLNFDPGSFEIWNGSDCVGSYGEGMWVIAGE